MKRTPNLLVREQKPPTRMIGLRVSQKEIDELRQYADEDCRSLAAFARLLMHRGLVAFLRERNRRK